MENYSGSGLNIFADNMIWPIWIIILLMIVFIVSLNTKGKLILAVTYFFALVMTYCAYFSMAPLRVCYSEYIPADPVECAFILFPSWLVVLFAHLYVDRMIRRQNNKA